MKNLKTLLFAAIILVAIVLRFYALGSNPPSLDWDEASIGYNAYSILHTGADEYGNKLPLSFRSFDDYKPPVYIYLTVPSVAAFGLNEFSVRFPAAFIGVLAVIALYYLVLELFLERDVKQASPGPHPNPLLRGEGVKSLARINVSEWTALVSAFFLAISPWHLQFSRAAFEGNVGMFFLILSLLLFFKAFKNKILYIPFGIAFILSMYSYHSFRLIDPIIFVFLIILFRKEILKQVLTFSLVTVAVVLLSLPIYISFLHPEGTGARLSMVTVFSDPTIQNLSAQKVLEAKAKHDVVGEIIYNRRLIFVPTIISGYLSHFSFDFLFLHGDSGVQHHAYNMGMLYLWDFPFILLGLWVILRKLDRRLLLLLIIFLLAPLPSAIATGAPHPVRAIAMIPEFQIFAAVGLVYLVFSIQYLVSSKRKKSILKLLAPCFLALLLLINFSYYLYSYYVLTPIKYGYFWQYGNSQAVEFAKQHENEYGKIIMSYKYDQPYIYYLFYNKIDPASYQKMWLTGQGIDERFYRKIGKYEFRNIDFTKDNLSTDTLLIGTPDEIPQSAKIIDTINFPDGRVAYRIAKT